MTPPDLTLDVLRGIQSTLVDMRGDFATANGRLASLERHAQTTNERLAHIDDRVGSLERHAIATRESIDLLLTQALTTGRALTTQMEARLRLDERVDDLQRRLEALERER